MNQTVRADEAQQDQKRTLIRKAIERLLQQGTVQGFTGKGSLDFQIQNGRIGHVNERLERHHA